MIAPQDAPAGAPPRDRLGWWLFGGSVALYLITQLVSLESFPIYFFCDEAVHSVAFRELAQNGFYSREPPHEFLPAYFRNGRMINLSLSVYLQGIASYLGGQSVLTVRVTSVLISLFGAVGLALLGRRIFRLPEWWSVVAFLAVTPALFLHSRTGFECVIMFAAYGWFLYFYLRYRDNQPRFLPMAVLFGAATFYSYAPGQGLMLATGILLGLVDCRYHWRHWRWSAAGLILAAVLLVPYLRFRLLHPTMLTDHLAEVRSYWVKPIPLPEKVAEFGRNYLAGFSPRYWFRVESPEKVVRHVVPFNGYIPWALAPFALLGLGVSLLGWKQAPHRVLLIAMLASGFSGALATPGVTRNLTFVASVAIFAALGFDRAMRWLPDGRGKSTVRAASFVLLVGAGAALVHDALAFGATRFRNYGLSGMQWGAQAIYRDLIPRYLPSHPLANVFVSHIWSNSPEVFPRFFGWYDQWRVNFLALEQVNAGVILPEERDLVVLTAPEYDALPRMSAIESFEVLERVPWPDGRIGFYLGHLKYRPGFLQEARARSTLPRRPATVRMMVAGVPASVAVVGVSNGGEDNIFLSTPHPPLEAPPDRPLLVSAYLDSPVALDKVEIIFTDDSPKMHLFWSMREDRVIVEERNSVPRKTSSIVIPMKGGMVNRLFFELRAAPGEPLNLQEIRLTPVTKPAPAAR